MPRININLDEVQGGFGIFPDGIFAVEIQESTKIKKSKSGGTNILWIAKILDGDYEGKMISWNTSLQENALWNLKSLLETINLEWDEDGFELEDAFGRQLFIHNTSGNTYNGQPVNTIDAYYNSETLKAMHENEQ